MGSSVKKALLDIFGKLCHMIPYYSRTEKQDPLDKSEAQIKIANLMANREWWSGCNNAGINLQSRKMLTPSPQPCPEPQLQHGHRQRLMPPPHPHVQWIQQTSNKNRQNNSLHLKSYQSWSLILIKCLFPTKTWPCFFYIHYLGGHKKQSVSLKQFAHSLFNFLRCWKMVNY